MVENFSKFDENYKPTDSRSSSNPKKKEKNKAHHNQNDEISIKEKNIKSSYEG